ncbi:MAG: helix-turn-helix transcriptional regulator [Chloroflexaceae bacterium]|nr:helix-turn-helix transcriptional regulator [Chloroflexaceae bacterium]
MRRFGEKLRTLRTARGMTVRELAHALGYTSHSHIGDVEIGKRKPSLELVMKVAQFFKVTMDQLTWDDLEV